MAINKNSNSYTFLFAITVVVIVGASLAAVAVGLKPRQDANVVVKKKMDILSAISIESTRKNADELYAQYIVEEECVVLNANGEPIEGDAFEVDIKKEYRDKNIQPEQRRFPLYVAEVDGNKKYIIPMVGSGLWGPIWGFISVDADMATVYGATFDHKGETPGLGAEIATAIFQDQFKSEKITENGEYVKIKIVKDGSGGDLHKVDGITGGTITSKGVEEMLDRTLQVYVKYFATKSNEL